MTLFTGCRFWVSPMAKQIEASYDKFTDERRKKSTITILPDLRLDF
jgi:hypothetical protein